MPKIFYSQESYAINGILFSIYNELGFGYQEKYYYRAIKNALERAGFTVQTQLSANLISNSQIIGRYFLDFLINDRIVLELKVANRVYPKHIQQVLGYLKSQNLKLGILAVFTKDGVIIKRIVN